MTARSRIGKYYVQRDRKGRIKKWVSIKRSMAVDKAKHAIRKVKSGYGNLGDIAIHHAFNS